MYCGIILDWDYDNRHVDISMPGYIKKKLQEYNHIMPQKIAVMPILTGAEVIWNRGTSPPPSRHYTETGCQKR
jgi:hypothetical protein